MRMLEAISQGVVLCYVLSRNEDDADLHMYHYCGSYGGYGHGGRTLLRNMRYRDITDECNYLGLIGNHSKFIARYGRDYSVTDTCQQEAMINEGYEL